MYKSDWAPCFVLMERRIFWKERYILVFYKIQIEPKSIIALISFSLI